MENSEKVKAWLENVIQHLVPTPSEVNVQVKKDDMGVLFTLRVNPKEWGYVIGKEGGNAKAVRTLLNAVGKLLDMKASLKIDAPEIKGY